MKKNLTLLLILASFCNIAHAQIVTETEVQTEEVATKATTNTRQRVAIDRGIEKSTFVGKGQWFVSGTISYTSFTADDFKLLILEDIKAQAYTLGLKAQVGYCFANNMAAGIGFDYNRNRVDIPKVTINLGETANIEIQDYYSIQQIYTATAFYRSYINLGTGKRFGLFSDIKLSVGGGQGKVLNGKGESLEGTYQKIFNAGIILEPGVSVFLTNSFSVEASIGILGIQYSRRDQITNQVNMGYYEDWKANFKVNLFSINLGMALYF